MAMSWVVRDPRQNTTPENRKRRCASVWNSGLEGSTWIGTAAATNTSRAFSAVDGGCCGAGGRLSDATTRRHRLRRRKRESLVTLCNICSAFPRSCHDEESSDGRERVRDALASLSSGIVPRVLAGSPSGKVQSGVGSRAPLLHDDTSQKRNAEPLAIPGRSSDTATCFATVKIPKDVLGADSVTQTRMVGLDFEGPVPEDFASLLCDDMP